MRKRKLIVVSAVNLIDGGTFTILQNFLESASTFKYNRFKIIFLVNKRTLLTNNIFKSIEIPSAKKNWIFRLYWEYIGFYFISKRIKPDIWISLHDTSPNVIADFRYVYCHNPSIFYKNTFSSILLDPKFFIFSFFYKIIYALNIHKNRYVIVQQEWIRNEFIRLFGLKNILVAHPSANNLIQLTEHPSGIKRDKFVIFFPALPRFFKNFEVLCEAVKLLPIDLQKFLEVNLTISGLENKYAKYIYKTYSDISCINFVGLQSHSEMIECYKQCDLVAFPSKLETWGLPISEAKIFSKSLLVADLPYAHETVGDYDKVSFLNPDLPGDWSLAIAQLYYGKYSFDSGVMHLPSRPFAQDWNALWTYILEDRSD